MTPWSGPSDLLLHCWIARLQVHAAFRASPGRRTHDLGVHRANVLPFIRVDVGRGIGASAEGRGIGASGGLLIMRNIAGPPVLRNRTTSTADSTRKATFRTG